MACLALSVATLLLWLLDATDRLEAPSLARAVIGLAAVSTVICSGRRALARRRGELSWRQALLPAILLLSAGVHLAGIEWEAGTGYYRDEGIYKAAAEAINAGRLLPESFIYGHLPYYLLAFAMWLAELFPVVVRWLAEGVYGVTEPARQVWIVLRAVSALFGTLTVVPVYLAARRIAGPASAILAALLIVFSPLYNEITHLVISDVPAAFFAALALPFVARLIERESRRDYLWAGGAAGLAAASKYPAGVVAIAIFAVWLRWRIRRRTWSWGLFLAAGAAIATMLLAMPALLAHGAGAFAGEGKDVFFGLRQYGRGGWIGVIKESNTLWYVEQLAASFRWPALLLGASGLLLLPRSKRWDLLWLAAFPLTYLLLLVAMSMVVKRNLLPAMPWLALIFAAGAGGWVAACRRLPARAGAVVAALLATVVVLPPLVATFDQSRSLTRASTTELARRWVEENTPPGARFVKESYTPRLDWQRNPWLQSRFVARRSLEEIQSPRNDFLMLAMNAYRRFLVPENRTKPHHHVMARKYDEMRGWEKLVEFIPGEGHAGPLLQIYRIQHPDQPALRRKVFTVADLHYVTPGEMPASGAAELAIADQQQTLIFAERFAAGRYHLALQLADGAQPVGLEVRSWDNRRLGESTGKRAELVVGLPEEERYFFYVRLRDGRFRALEVAPESARVRAGTPAPTPKTESR